MFVSSVLSALSVTTVVGMAESKCNSGMVEEANSCYKWYDQSLSLYDARQICEQTRGSLAGTYVNFLEVLKSSPSLQGYLPDRKFCYWVAHSGHKSGRVNEMVGEDSKEYRWYEKVVLFLALFQGETVCFDGQEWTLNYSGHKKALYFICRYDVAIYRTPTKQTVKPSFTIKRKSVSTAIVDRPLFRNVAPLPTMCSRLCQSFAECNVFNYNTASGECRGYDKLEGVSCDHDDEWEVWVVG